MITNQTYKLIHSKGNHKQNEKTAYRDFPGSSVVNTSPTNAGGVGSIPGRGAKIPHASRPKNQNIKQKQ